MDTNNVTILGCPGAPAAATATPAPRPRRRRPPATAAPTATPALPLLPPATGGPPLESGGFSWTLVLVASVIGSLGAVVLGLSARMRTASANSRRAIASK